MCACTEFFLTWNFPERRSKLHLFYCKCTKLEFQSIVIRQNTKQSEIVLLGTVSTPGFYFLAASRKSCCSKMGKSLFFFLRWNFPLSLYFLSLYFYNHWTVHPLKKLKVITCNQRLRKYNPSDSCLRNLSLSGSKNCAIDFCYHFWSSSFFCRIHTLRIIKFVTTIIG